VPNAPTHLTNQLLAYSPKAPPQEKAAAGVTKAKQVLKTNKPTKT
jgi:hypothetical protein